MKSFRLILITTIIAACSGGEKAFLELPTLFSEGMVLQQQADVNIWGRTAPGAKVEVYTSWGAKEMVKAGHEGSWSIVLKTPEAGGPYQLGVQTADTSILIEDVLLGEVWICSGQSNMEMSLTGWPPTDTILNSASEIARADFPEIRFFTVPRAVEITESEKLDSRWLPCNPETVKDFSATAYYFGRDIHLKIGVPVGLIHSSWGGTPAESWTSGKYLEQFPAYKAIIDSFPVAEEQLKVLKAWMSKLEVLPVEIEPDFWKETIGSRNSNADVGSSVRFQGEMPVPGFWESSVLPNFDGIVRVKTQFDVPGVMAGSEAVLALGPVDDMDIAYLNGTRIGETMESGMWQVERHYHIPAGILKEKANVLEVIIVDNTGGGGIHGKEVALIGRGGKKIVLSGNWKYHVEAEIFEDSVYFYTEESSYAERPVMSISLNAWTPSALYNGMIHPVIPYTIRGAIWYQGESNVGRGYEYRKLFPALISSWREAWGQGDFPFYFVQIAPWSYGDDVRSAAAELREAQLMTLEVPNTGMAVTTDIGNVNNIHPADKKSVGQRLARWAQANEYGFDSLVVSGPLYESFSVKGDSIIVSFRYTAEGLVARGGPLKHFELAGEDKIYHPAQAEIAGNQIVVTSPEVKDPVAVRFGWSAIAEPNLFNSEGLPASPFRSDNWERLSQN